MHASMGPKLPWVVLTNEAALDKCVLQESTSNSKTDNFLTVSRTLLASLKKQREFLLYHKHNEIRIYNSFH